MKTNVLAPAVAASLAVLCVAAPVAAPAIPEAAAVSLAVSSKSIAPQNYSVAAPATPTPTRLDVLGLSQNVDPQTYTAVYTVINNAITVVRVPPSLLLTAQPAAAQSAAAATRYTLLDVLGLPIQTALAIVAGGTAGVTLPTSPLIPSPYTSVYTVINNAIAVVRVPLSLAFTGQFADIAPQTEAAFTTFVTSLTQGLPDSIRGTLEYDRSVIDSFLGIGDGDPNLLGKRVFATVEASEATEFEADESQDSTPAPTSERTDSTGYVKRLRAAAVKESRGAGPAEEGRANAPESTPATEKTDKADAAGKRDRPDKRDRADKRPTKSDSTAE